MSPVKCLPVDYGMGTQTSTVLNSGIDAFSFDPGVNSTASCPAQPKPRKFFKSRATEDVTKNSSNVQNSSLHPSCVDFPLNHGEIQSGANLYPAVSGGVGYLSPTYTSPTLKTSTKRGRGRPKGTRITSPRGSATATYKPNPGRGGTARGRRRAKGNRTGRGQQSGGRGKRKRPQWEGESESEEEDEAVSSELEEPTASAVEAEEEEQESEELENKNGEEYCDEIESKEEPKPPIKLRIIRRNDTNAFVSKVGSEPESVESDSLSTTPTTEISKQESLEMLESEDKDVDLQPAPTEPETPTASQFSNKTESPEHHSSIEVGLLSIYVKLLIKIIANVL